MVSNNYLFDDNYIKFMKTSMVLSPCGHSIPEPEARIYFIGFGTFSEANKKPCPYKKSLYSPKCGCPVATCTENTELRQVGEMVEKMKKLAILEADKRNGEVTVPPPSYDEAKSAVEGPVVVPQKVVPVPSIPPPTYIESKASVLAVAKEEEKEVRIKYPGIPQSYTRFASSDDTTFNADGKHPLFKQVRFSWVHSSFTVLYKDEDREKIMTYLKSESIQGSFSEADIIFKGENMNKFYKIWTENNRVPEDEQIPRYLERLKSKNWVT